MTENVFSQKKKTYQLKQKQQEYLKRIYKKQTYRFLISINKP